MGIIGCQYPVNERKKCGEEVEYIIEEDWIRGFRYYEGELIFPNSGSTPCYSCPEHVIPNITLKRPGRPVIEELKIFYLKGDHKPKHKPIFSSPGGRKLKKNLPKLEEILKQHAFEALKKSIE